MSNKQRLQVNNTNLLEHLSNIMNLPIGNLYAGSNPLTIGEEGATIPANTLLKETLQIINGVEPGVTGIDYGEVTFSTKTSPATINHNLGVAPRIVMIIQKELELYGESITTGVFYPIWVSNSIRKGYIFAYAYISGGYRLMTTTGDGNDITLTAKTITFIGSYKGSYVWAAIA